MADCTVSLTAGADIQPHLTAGAVVCLAPGRYPGALRVEVPVTLQASDGATLDAQGRGPVVHVAANGIQVRLQGLTLTGGAAEFGAGLLVDAYAEVAVDGCTLDGNEPGQGGGAGIGALRGRLLLRDVQARSRQDVVLDGVAEVAGEDVQLAGTLHVRDGARVALQGGRIHAVSVRGTTTRQPELVLEGVETGSVTNDPTVPGVVRTRP